MRRTAAILAPSSSRRFVRVDGFGLQQVAATHERKGDRMTQGPSQDVASGSGPLLSALLGFALLALAQPARAEPAAAPEKAATATTSANDAADDPDALA